MGRVRKLSIKANRSLIHKIFVKIQLIKLRKSDKMDTFFLKMTNLVTNIRALSNPRLGPGE